MTDRFHAVFLLMAILWQIVFMLESRSLASRVVKHEHTNFHWQNIEYQIHSQKVQVKVSDRTFKHFHTGDGSIESELLVTGPVPLAIVESPSLWDSPVKALDPTTYFEDLLRPPN